MIESEYITADEWDTLAKKWDAGWTGESWFKKDTYGIEHQAYITGKDKLVSFIQCWGTRGPFHLKRDEYERLFNE